MTTKQKSQEIYKKALLVVQMLGDIAFYSREAQGLTFRNDGGLSISYTVSGPKAAKREELIVRHNGSLFVRTVGGNGEVFVTSEAWGEDAEMALCREYDKAKAAESNSPKGLRRR